MVAAEGATSNYRNAWKKSLFGIGIFTASLLSQSGNGIPKQGPSVPSLISPALSSSENNGFAQRVSMRMNCTQN
jgi:hypothetical protein